MPRTQIHLSRLSLSILSSKIWFAARFAARFTGVCLFKSPLCDGMVRGLSSLRSRFDFGPPQPQPARCSICEQSRRLNRSTFSFTATIEAHRTYERRHCLVPRCMVWGCPFEPQWGDKEHLLYCRHHKRPKDVNLTTGATNNRPHVILWDVSSHLDDFYGKKPLRDQR